jgi:hypothetical protein
MKKLEKKWSDLITLLLVIALGLLLFLFPAMPGG